MKLFLFAAGHFSTLSLLAIGSYVFGRRVAKAISFSSWAEEIVFCTSLGLGVIAYLVLLIGLSHILYQRVVFGLLLILQIPCYSVWRDLLRRVVVASTGRRHRAMRTIKLFVCIIVLTPFWLLPLLPPTAFDAIMYHLPYAKIYVQNHAIVLTPFLRFPVSPQINEMLFALMLLFQDDISAQLVQFLMMIFVAVALYTSGRRLFSARVGLAAAIFWLSTRYVILLGSTAYIDVGLTLFITLAVSAMLNWLIEKKRGWLLMSAAFTGMAAGAKYSALFFFGALATIALYRSVREHRLFDFVVFVSIASCVAAPWYLRNSYLTGNPIFPFLPSFFGYSLWNRIDLQGQLGDWMRSGLFAGAIPQDARMLVFPIFWILPVVIWFGLKRPYIRTLLLLSLSYVLFWLSSASLPRYVLPVVPILSLATAASTECLLLKMSFIPKWMRTTPVVICCIMLLLYPNWHYAARQEYRKGIATDQRQRDIYLTQELVSYKAYKYLNAERGGNYRLYALYDANMAYFADGTFMGDWFGPARYSQIVDNMTSGKALFRALRNLDADHFLVVTNQTQVTLPNDEFFDDHFKLVCAAPEMMLFELQGD